jgi:hypothetical protein
MAIAPVVIKELQWKSTKFVIDGCTDEKQCEHDITMVVTN